MTYFNKIRIQWTDEVHIDESWDSENVDECGLYFITRKYVRNGIEKQMPLYVGITTRNFYKRLCEHFQCDSKWTNAYGRKYIQFGKIHIYKEDTYDLKALLIDVESDIINKIEEEHPNELLNVQQKNSSNYHYNLEIFHENNEWLEE
ncbi:MAG: GIY-YIG nuclease family protein [Muribaculaceae bacterium]